MLVTAKMSLEIALGRHSSRERRGHRDARVPVFQTMNIFTYIYISVHIFSFQIFVTRLQVFEGFQKKHGDTGELQGVLRVQFLPTVVRCVTGLVPVHDIF